ncbi:MAG: alpha,6-mannosyltransferase [Actinoplanes sp.]|jgi:alpha-1,6-mannosyltransferase|nr:alpha,6-mannosyltransferase [Actinoplanes sp.]
MPSPRLPRRGAVTGSRSRAEVCRWTGFAGSLLLAVAAELGGARSPFHPPMTPGTIAAGHDGVLLPLSWLLGTGLLIGAWVAGVRAVPSARWAYLTAALWAVPLLPVLPLGSYDIYSYACQGWQQAAGLDPYSAGVDALGCPWRSAVSPTWLDSPAPYGPFFLVLAAAAATIGGGLTGTVAALRVVALLGVLLAAVSLPVVARRCGVPLGRAVWLALACPLIAIHLVSGGHNDAVMVGLLVAALAVIVAPGSVASRPPSVAETPYHDEQDPITRCTQSAAGTLVRSAEGQAVVPLLLAGVLLGLAIGVKVTAVVVLPFAVLAAVPSGSSLRALLRPTVALVGGVVVTIAALCVGSGLGFGWITNLAGSGASVQWTAPSTAVGLTGELIGSWFGLHLHVVTVTRILGIIALAGVLVGLWWRTRTRDALPGAGLALAATVALAPVFHPWYATWPLTVLAATGLRRWLVATCAVAAALCLPDGYNLALAVRSQGSLAMTTFLIYLAVRRLRRPA